MAGTNTGVRLHAFHFEVDADGLPTAYLGYETIDLDLADGALTLADLAFEAVASADLTGTTSQPVGYADTLLFVLARFGPNLSMPISGGESPGAAFEYRVPVLSGLSYDVVFVGTRPGDSVYTWRHDVGLDAGALDLVSPATPSVPADGATGVGLATTFATSVGGGARTYIWLPDAAGPFIGLTTTRTSVTIPDPALGGFADYFTILYGSAEGGPGLDGDRSLGFPTFQRQFTFAP